MTKSKIQKKPDKWKYTELQRKTLVVCAAIMMAYIALICIFVRESFWSLAAIHTVLAAITVLFIWLGGAPKITTYMVVFISLVGAATVSGLVLYYLLLLSIIANG